MMGCRVQAAGAFPGELREAAVHAARAAAGPPEVPHPEGH
jgi:hypothetical protein